MATEPSKLSKWIQAHDIDADAAQELRVLVYDFGRDQYSDGWSEGYDDGYDKGVDDTYAGPDED